MKIYLASSFLNKQNARQVMDLFEKHGHIITYDWTVHEHTTDEAVLRREAVKDIDGVKVAEVFVLLQPFRFSSSAEFGGALINGKLVFIVGDAAEAKEKILFAHHPDVILLPTPMDVIDRLKWIEQEKDYHSHIYGVSLVD